MENFEAFRWNFSSSTNPEFGWSAAARSTQVLIKPTKVWDFKRIPLGKNLLDGLQYYAQKTEWLVEYYVL